MRDLERRPISPMAAGAEGSPNPLQAVATQNALPFSLPHSVPVRNHFTSRAVRPANAILSAFAQVDIGIRRKGGIEHALPGEKATWNVRLFRLKCRREMPELLHG